MTQTITWNRNVQLAVALLGALALKLCYSTASPNQLRWILGPSTVLVQLVSGKTFMFESYAGYISSDRSVLIAASCAGVNFLITAFLMLSLRRLWKTRSQDIGWKVLPTAAVVAYLVTLVANTVRISTALWLQAMAVETRWLSPNQLHRFEGIVIYFGFLLVLFLVSEKVSSENASCLLRRSVFPLLMYYSVTLGIPLARGLYQPQDPLTHFWEHSLFVVLTPLLLIAPLVAFRFFGVRRPGAAFNQSP